MRRVLPMLTCCAALAAAAAAADDRAPLVLVLDASGSMWGQVRGEAKIVGARRVIGELAGALDPATPVALVAYGHRRQGDCADIEAVVPLGALERSGLVAAVGGIDPKGKTPITAAVERALAIAPAGARVVVVTDGLETCGGDPCAAVRTAKGRGSEFILHVVGLDVEKEDVSSLECAAQAGGGLFLAAADAAGLAAALETAVARPAEVPAGALVLGATRNGALQDVSVRVQPIGGGEEIGARTYAAPATNPRVLPLADGRYRVRATAMGVDGAAERSFEIEIADGGRVERTLDYSTGELAIGATRNGELSDVTWEVFAPGERKRAAATGRTYRSASSNPARAVLPAGDYEVVLHALEIGGKPVAELGRVTVPAGGKVDLAHDFASGDLLVGAVRGGALVDATVAVRAGGRSVASGRTYDRASSNPKRFTLAPGDYEVDVAEIRGETRRLAVTIAAEEERALTIDFAQP